MGGGHAFQGIQGFFRLGLLHHAQHGVEHNDQQDEQRLKEFHGVVAKAGHHKAHCRGQQQNDDHGVLELLQKALQVGLLLLFSQLVFPILPKALLGLLAGEARL